MNLFHRARAVRPAMKMSKLALVISLFITGTSTDAQNIPTPKDRFAVPAFASVFDRIWASSMEDESFQSIKGDFDRTKGGWRVTLALPGASTCLITNEIQGRRMAGRDVPLPVFQCNFTADAAEGPHAFKSFLQVVQSVRRDWRTTPPGSEPIIILGPHFSGHDHLNGNVTFVARTDDQDTPKFKSAVCYEPRHLSASWTKCLIDRPDANLGLMVYPPSKAPAGKSDCPPVY